MNANEYIKDFDIESQKILQISKDKIVPENSWHNKKPLFNSLSESNLPSKNTDTIDLLSDEDINLKLLVGLIKLAQSGSRDYQFEYNLKQIAAGFSQTSISDGKNGFIRLKTYHNPRIGNVSVKWNDVRITQEINVNKKAVYYRLHFYYTDTHATAFILETIHYQEFRNLNMLLNYGDIDFYEDDYNYFLKNFTDVLRKETDASRLKFVYENIPETILQNVSVFLDSGVIFNQINILTELDDTGIFSGWKDGSSALMNALRCLDHIFLLKEFQKTPSLCNRIYYNLDKVSELDGLPQPNRVIFANILQQFCLFSQKRPKSGAPTFLTGKGYKIRTDVMELSGKWLGFGQSDSKTFFLQQQQKYISDEPAEYETDDLGIATTVKSQSRMKNLNDGAQYHPLEMVYFVNEDEKYINPETGEQMPPVTMIVPAIYVKAMADAEKWEEINYFIRITADILAVTLGIVTLATTGNPYLILAAMADLSLAGIDLTVQALRNEIAKLPEGESFLEDWDLIYGVGGIIIAAPQLIVSAYRGIFVLIPKAAKNVQQGLKAMAISLFLDLNSGVFQRKDLRVFSPTEWVIPSAGFFSKTAECDALVRNGAFFMELDAAAIMENINKGNGINPDVIGAISSNRKFALVYEGEIIAQGSRYDKAYQKTLMDLKRTSTNAEKGEEILKDLLFERIYIKYEGQFKIKFHHHFDGEILIKQKRGEDVLELFGAHNHDVVGTKIQFGPIRKPPGINSFHDLPDDIPFKANVEMKYGSGIVKKKNTSSFFPKNWDIKRVKKEIALVYNEMLKSGKVYDPRATNRKFDFLCSNGSFRIQIEFDELGNLTSAYPIVN